MHRLFVLSLCLSILLTGCTWQDHNTLDIENNERIPLFSEKEVYPSSIESDGNWNQELVTVLKIKDGDTIVYKTKNGETRTGRLIGINASEIKDNQLYADSAALYLEQLIGGKQIYIEGDSDEMDKYGRYLIHAFIGKKSIQSILLMEGLARVAYLYGDYKYIDMYKEAEAIAKDTELNIWSIPNYVNEQNGFTMSVVSNSVKKEIEGKLSEWKDEIINNLSESYIKR